MIYDLQKASITKRISAFLFDIIIFGIIAVGVAFLVSAAIGYDAKVDALEAEYAKYEQLYDIDRNISEEDYNALTEAEKARYEEASKAMSEDGEIVRLYSMMLSMTILVVSISLLVAFVISELTVPLIFKNGQTLGKKVFGVAIMRVDGVKVSAFQMFVRTVLGKFTIETMIPVFLLLMVFFGTMSGLGLVAAVLMLLIQLGFILFTRTHSALHDILAVTVTVDMSSQMIFDSPEELMAYKKRIHEENVTRSPY